MRGERKREETMKRSIISIDEEKCNGCGLCIPNCPEGAIQIIDNKARLVSDIMCDGLGAVWALSSGRDHRSREGS